jgi:hypothetical protein
MGSSNLRVERIMELTYWEISVLLAMTPGAVFVAYWKGHARGKREGYISGRSLTRVPVRNEG